MLPVPSILIAIPGSITGCFVTGACRMGTAGGGFVSTALLSEPRGVALGVGSGSAAVSSLKAVVARIGLNVLPREPGLRWGGSGGGRRGGLPCNDGGIDVSMSMKSSSSSSSKLCVTSAR